MPDPDDDLAFPDLDDAEVLDRRHRAEMDGAGYDEQREADEKRQVRIDLEGD